MAINIRNVYVNGGKYRIHSEPGFSHFNHALNHMASLNTEAALQEFTEALKHDPGNPRYRFQMGLAYLLDGQYRSGFELCECRFDAYDYMVKVKDHYSPVQRWYGEDLGGKTLLLWNEQGRGDLFFYLRYVSMVKERTNCRIILDVTPDVIPLLNQHAGIDGFLFEQKLEPHRQCSICSLPYLLGTTETTVPRCGQYLYGTDSAFPFLDRGERPVIGVCLTGDPQHLRNSQRTLPLDQILKLKDFGDLVSLQLEPINHPDIMDMGDQLTHYQDTADLISECDIVVSCDTGVAHLSAALGKPTIVMLPFLCDWRWGKTGNESAWYESVELFRQPTEGDWTTPFDDLVTYLSVCEEEGDPQP